VPCQNPTHNLTWCFTLGARDHRLVYLFMVRVFGWHGTGPIASAGSVSESAK
jgi:hypothetical protein